MDRRILSDYVCWVGDEAGVAVAAESEEIAEQALSAVDVEWDVLPFVLDIETAMKPGAPVIHPEITSKGNVLPPDDYWGHDVMIQRGDVEKCFAEADVTIEANSRYSKSTHAVLDNWCCLVECDYDRLTVWSNSYDPDMTRMYLSEMMGIPLNNVRVISPYLGAQMGRGDTGEQTFFVVAALLSRKTGRPVKFRHTRRESFHDTRTPQVGYCKIGARRDGTIDGLYMKQLGECGAYADLSVAATKFVPQEYIHSTFLNIPNLKFEAYLAYTNRIPSSCMRGIGHIQANYLTGLAIDILAEKLGLDPIELILKNIGYPPLPNKSLETVLREGARRIGWENRHKPGEGPTEKGTKKHGLGFSFHCGWHAAWQEVGRGPIQVMIRVNPDGTVILEAPTAETGTGSNTCVALVCAETLGVCVKDVHWISTVDTERSLKDQVQTDSAVSYVFAEAIQIAALDAKRQILELAAREMNAPPNELDIEEGRIYVKKTPEKGLPVKTLLSNGDMVPILAYASKPLPSEVTGVPYLATFVDVEVDIETGQVSVSRMVVVNDVGTVMYASGAEGQQVGGQCMGLGESLTEELIYDEKTGVPLNFDLINYKMPMLLDFPEIDPVLMEVWKGAGEYGACGLGESVMTCTPRAVANAVYNAIGVRIDSLPITPTKVLEALGKIQGDTDGS
jgi:xanthine dehydrogenase molybdenum-binding subunit